MKKQQFTTPLNFFGNSFLTIAQALIVPGILRNSASRDAVGSGLQGQEDAALNYVLKDPGDCEQML